MTREKLKTTFIVASLAAMVVVSFIPASIWGNDGHDHSAMESEGGMHHHSEADLANVHLKQLPAVLQALKAVEKAVQSNNKRAALLALKKAKKQVWAIKTITGKHIQSMIINSQCPISGDKINVAKLTAETVRPHDGKLVAFCCLDCPPEWDKLSDAEKDAKLSKVSAQSVWTCSMHPQIRKSMPGKCPLCSMTLVPATVSHEEAGHSHDGGDHQDGHAGHNH